MERNILRRLKNMPLDHFFRLKFKIWYPFLCRQYCRLCHEFCYQMKDVCKEQTLMDNGPTLLFFLNYAMLSVNRDLFWFFNNYLKFSIFIRLIISFKKICLIDRTSCGRRPTLVLDARVRCTRCTPARIGPGLRSFRS